MQGLEPGEAVFITMLYLDRTTKVLHKHTRKRYKEGKIRPHIGMQGHLVLMMDKLDRILLEPETRGKEMLELASDALVALWLFTSARIQEKLAEEEIE